MTSPTKPAKRKQSTLDAPVSPPPLRRKVQSTTTRMSSMVTSRPIYTSADMFSETAVASFFTPASQKPPEKVVWQERAPNDDTPNTLLVGKYEPANDPVSTSNEHESRKKKVAAFDFDSTLIETASGKKFASNSQDWKWWHPSVPEKLRKLYLEDGYRIVAVSNQGGVSLKPNTKAPKAHTSKVASFKEKVSVVFNQLDIPMSIYAATEKDIFRKPRTGMWAEVLDDYDIQPDLNQCIFVGDAGGRHAEGRKPKDFSCSDRNFAENIGIKFQTPEEFFLGEAPRPFTRTIEPADYLPESAAEAIAPFVKKNDIDIVIFCGSPGAGKSTFYWKYLKPLGYARVNQDVLKTRDKCLKVAGEYLSEKKSVVVDNTNADIEVRSKWIDLATKHSIPIRCVLFTAAAQICEHNDAVRALNSTMNPEERQILPGIAFSSFKGRYKPPKVSEGFQDITEIEFKVSLLLAVDGLLSQVR
ncbi:Bifunctional polynucleotide phosphatase/kinase [Lachnellula occidentalis]|uniref:Bifunctional polynucleotide phosphatase/kinase n=1 Tax=Lachnellula occidentalis TaxID=215460 RepID=A0A8H8UKA6_9HELO|nr:Bifunctional polynucleotide phosphatase/kinase [Lachnellula occidentalis]